MMHIVITRITTEIPIKEYITSMLIEDMKDMNNKIFSINLNEGKKAKKKKKKRNILGKWIEST